MNTLARTLLLLAAWLSTPLAHALGLGGITGTGALGAPLDAQVPLYLAPGEQASLLGAEVLPDMFARDSMPIINELRAAIEHDTNGSYVHVTSVSALKIGHLRFRLRVNTTQGAFIARYAVRTLAPRTPRTGTSMTTRPRSSTVRITSPLSTHVAAPTEPLSGAATYGPVRNGESLWKIANRLAHARNVRVTMQTLHALNPSAFIGGDLNRLRVGVTLRLPADAGITATTSQAGAQASVTPMTVRKEQAALATREEADVARDEMTAAINEARDAQPDDAPSTVAVIGKPAGDMSGTKTRTAGEQGNGRAADNTALVRELSALDAKFAAIRAKYGATALGSVETTAPVAKPKLGASDARPTQAPAAAEATARAAKPVANAGRENAAPVTGASEGGLADGWPQFSLALIALVAAGLTVRQLNRSLLARRSRASAADVKASDADRKAEVARKAENRIRMESEIQGLLKRKHSPPAIAQVAPRSTDVLAETTNPPMSPFEQTLDPLAVTSGGNLLEQDREVAIDANIAHGRYAEAEVLLREVIASHPRNVQAKLRLAEVYYITEKVDGFASVATDIKDHHRADLTDDEWQRVVRMGKIIAPDLTLFSGPKAVGKRA